MPVPTATNIAGKGCDLQLSISSTYTSIAGVKSISGPGIKIGTRDVTSLLSSWMESAPTIPDGGELTVSIMYDNTSDTQKQIQTLIATPPSTGSLWKIFLPTTTKYFGFNAHITGFAISGMEVEGTVMAELGLKVNGAMTFPTT